METNIWPEVPPGGSQLGWIVENVRPGRSNIDKCTPLSCSFPLPFVVVYLPSTILLYALCMTLDPAFVHVLLPPPSGLVAGVSELKKKQDPVTIFFSY
jgi:hypothetical protein